MTAAVLLALLTNSKTLDDVLADPRLKGATVAAIVIKDDGSVVYSKNAATRVLPASNEKILTGAYALTKLGADFVPTTEFWKKDGLLLISSKGNPDLTLKDYKDFRIENGLIDLSVSLKQSYRPGWPSTWPVGDLPNRYAPFISSITVDRGGMELFSDSGRLELMNDSFGLHPIWITSDTDAHVEYDPVLKELKVRGRFPKGRKRLDTLSIPEPDLAVGRLFGTVGTSARDLDVDPGASKYVLKGKPLATTLQNCFTVSQNCLAENLLLMAADSEGELGASPYETASSRLSQFLESQVKLQPGDVFTSDGSGVSRQDLVTTRALAQTLLWMSKGENSAAWLAAFPKFGIGTMTNRGKGHAILAKDGTLKQVSSYSGYLTKKSGERLIFSLVFNYFSCSDAEARAVQDEFVAELDK